MLIAALIAAAVALVAMFVVPDLRCALGSRTDGCDQRAAATSAPVRIAASTNAPLESPVAQATFSPDAPGPGYFEEGDAAALADAMIALANEARREAGLEPFRVNEILSGTAQAHADEIASSGSFSHTSADGRSAKQRALDAGYGAGGEGVRVGENFVARATVEEAFQWLMGDPPHRENILHTVYREIGVGVRETSFGYVWVMDFGTYDGADEAAADGQADSGPLGQTSSIWRRIASSGFRGAPTSRRVGASSRRTDRTVEKVESW